MPKEYQMSFNLSWDNVENACLDISSKIIKADFKPDIVLPVLWGGVIPCRLIMDILDMDRTKCKPIISRSYESCESKNDIYVEMHFPVNNYSDRKVLIVEEIVDSGRTIKRIKELLFGYGFKFENIMVATLVWRDRSLYSTDYIVPNFFHKIIDKEWIIFPWDKQEYLRTLNGKIS